MTDKQTELQKEFEKETGDEDGMCVIHNAWDNREVIEKVEAVLSQTSKT